MLQNEMNFLSISPSKKQKTIAGMIAILITAVSLFSLPFAQKPLPEINAFLPAFIALICGMDTLTGYLFLRQFYVTKSMPMLFLSGTYFFSSWITIPHLLTFPKVFSPTGLLGAGTQTAVWFWVIWHGGVAIGVLLYLLSFKFQKIITLKGPSTFYACIMFGSISLLIFILSTFLTRSHDYLPVIVQTGNYHILVSSNVGPTVFLFNFLALIGVIKMGRIKDVLHLWLLLAVLASLLDITVTLYAGARFSLGWYVARINSLVSAMTVFSIFLFELNRLYVTLSQHHIELQETHSRLIESFQEIEAQSEEIQAQKEEILSYQSQQYALLSKLQEYTRSLEANHFVLEGKQNELQSLYSKIKIQEERYRTLTSFLPDGLAVLQEGNFVYLNPACASLFGLNSNEEWNGRSILSIMSSEYRPLAEERMERILHQKKIAPLVEYKMYRKDGMLIDVEASGTHISYEGHPSILIVIRDVTKRKELENELKEMNIRLERLAHADGLTGILNRRSFDIYLQEEWKKSIRNKRLLSLILFDIDHFKAYNDTYGHQSGDEVLKQVAMALERSIKRSGVKGFRYGGEEFAVILPETDSYRALKVAENICIAIQKLSIPHKNSKVSDIITGSFGLVTIIPTLSLEPKDLIEKADQALYQSKRAGRNQVSSFDLSTTGIHS